MDENTFVMTDADGNEVVCHILFTTNLEGFEGNYVVFQMEDSEEVTAAKYVEISDGEGELVDIETDEEWEKIEEVLNSYFDDLEGEE